MYQAAVIGAGPGGLAAVLSLLDHGVKDIAWIDPTFGGGRLNELYREISSNTKVGIYLDALESSKTCERIINGTPKPNAVTKLEEKDRESTTLLSYAGDMVMLLEKKIWDSREVEKLTDKVDELVEIDGGWDIKLDSGSTVSAKRVILCTGSHPIVAAFHEEFNSRLKVLELDTVLRKSLLPDLLGLNHDHTPTSNAKITVGVIGNSHSGVLAIRNFYEVSTSSEVPMEIVSFARRPIVYAEYREDGIVHDNTGLKGSTAEWSKEVMESDHPGSHQCPIRRIDLGKTKESEREVYCEWLPKCTHLVYAIGYKGNDLPRISSHGKRIDQELEFDMHTSGFTYKLAHGQVSEEGSETVRGLYGCGIAFPEEVEDPEGNVEAAVGIAKFFKFAERVSEKWTE